LTRVVLPRLRLGSLFYFDTHTNTLRHPRRTPTLTSTPTSTHFARMQRFAGTEKQILDEPCTPVNHKQRMHKGEEGQASRHKQESCGWGCKSHFEATCGARGAMEVCRSSAMNVVLAKAGNFEVHSAPTSWDQLTLQSALLLGCLASEKNGD